MKAVIYAQISLKKAEKGVSISYQIEKLKEYCKNKNIKIVENNEIIAQTEKKHRKLLSDIAIRGLRRRAEFGLILGNSPIGYLNVLEVGKITNVVVDHKRAPIIRELFKKYATGNYDLTEITAEAKKLGLRSKIASGNHLAKRQIRLMLQNPFYYGCMEFKGELYPHVYTPIISKELFLKCQKVMKAEEI